MIADFPSRQTLNGYFRSQEGEWDSNGQVLWIAGRLHDLAAIAYDDGFLKAIFSGAHWIIASRRLRNSGVLLPPGFSAEHLGPNNYYYTDNFWCLAGLHAAGRLAGDYDFPKKQDEFYRQAVVFQKRILESIEKIPEKKVTTCPTFNRYTYPT